MRNKELREKFSEFCFYLADAVLADARHDTQQCGLPRAVPKGRECCAAMRPSLFMEQVTRVSSVMTRKFCRIVPSDGSRVSEEG